MGQKYTAMMTTTINAKYKGHVNKNQCNILCASFIPSPRDDLGQPRIEPVQKEPATFRKYQPLPLSDPTKRNSDTQDVTPITKLQNS